MEPNWADLPAEMITLISEKASTNIQYVHLRAVCKSWRRTLTPNPRHLPHQTPWLILPPDANDFHQSFYYQTPLLLPHDAVNDFDLSFYDLSQSKTHRFDLPYVRGKYIYGSCYGWLVVEHDHRMSLHNPINRSSIELPSFDAPLISIPLLSGHCVQKVVLSCNPSERGCVVVAWFFYPSKCELALCRIGDTHWTGVLMTNAGQDLLDFTCNNHSVYMVNHKREVLAYDLESLAMRTFPSKINYKSMNGHINLVEGDVDADGSLVVITTDYVGDLKQIYVYRWINYEQRWRRVKNIGRSVLFLSRGNCTKLHLEEQHGNEIYFAIRHDVSMRYHINKMNLQSGAVVSHCSAMTSWFTPSLI